MLNLALQKKTLLNSHKYKSQAQEVPNMGEKQAPLVTMVNQFICQIFVKQEKKYANSSQVIHKLHNILKMHHNNMILLPWKYKKNWDWFWKDMVSKVENLKNLVMQIKMISKLKLIETKK